jgi:hypothetical protein
MAAGDLTATRGNYSDYDCNVFDGVDDYVEIPYNAAQLGANLANGFTISAWVNPRSLGESNGGRVLDKSDSTSAGNGFRVGMVSAASFGLRLNAGTACKAANNATPVGTWTHILVTVTAGQLSNFYVNGVLSGTANQDLVQTISIITTTNPLRIGNRAYDTGSTFDGAIRHVKMWKRVLTAAEIAADYAGTPATSGLIHWFKLGGDYADYGSVGVTATNSGSVQRIVEDLAKTAIKTQRTTAGATGKYMIFSGRAGQLGSVAITE